MLQKLRYPAGPASSPPPAREQLSPPSNLGVFRKKANWRNEPNLEFFQVYIFKQYAIIFRAAQGQKRTQNEPKQTQNEPNFKANNAILTVRTGLFWHCLCRKVRPQMRALMKIPQHSLTVNNRTLNFSEIQAPSPSSRLATGTGKFFPFVQPNLGGLRRKIKNYETNPN